MVVEDRTYTILLLSRVAPRVCRGTVEVHWPVRTPYGSWWEQQAGLRAAESLRTQGFTPVSLMRYRGYTRTWR